MGDTLLTWVVCLNVIDWILKKKKKVLAVMFDVAGSPGKTAP